MQDFLDVFLLMYKAFATPDMLLKKLAERCADLSLGGPTELCVYARAAGRRRRVCPSTTFDAFEFASACFSRS